MIQIGTIIDDRYEVLKEIGRGGMSIVYLAMDNRLNKSLVVKDIRKRSGGDQELLINSLVAEANMLKKLDHGALPKIYDIIESAGDIYVVMDYIEGESLKEKLKRENIIVPKQVVEWAKQLSDVLGYLHTRKPNPIIYRDMKPDNIMLTPEGKIKLIDFGIAREFKAERTTDTTNLGTRTYAAPEQLSGKQTDARTDIYSLGVTLYHLVTGKSLSEPPFEVRPIRQWDASLPEGLEHIINKCTQAEPDHRYQSCTELMYDLENMNKLTAGYKKKQLKKLYVFFIPAVLSCLFTATAVFGYQGIQKEQFQNYMTLVNDAGKHVMQGDEVKAIETLEQAITTVDAKRPEAYVNLLDLYISRNETDLGLSKIETYIHNEYGGIHKNDEVLFKVGMAYFDMKRDPASALRYFQRVDPEKIEAAKYYQSLATTMSSMNINYREFTDRLAEFEAYNDSLANDSKKIENYNALAGIYLSYKKDIPDANTRVIALTGKAQDVLKKLEDEQAQADYEAGLEQKLAQAYYSRAVNEKDKEAARKDFEKAIEHYGTLQDMDGADKVDIYIRKAAIYQDMGNTARALKQLQAAVKQDPYNLGAHTKLGNLLLDMEQSKEESTRNYAEAKRVYEKILTIKGAAADESVKKLERRLVTLKVI